MKLLALGVVAAVLASSGCLDDALDALDHGSSAPVQPAWGVSTYFLKPGMVLSEEPPTSRDPEGVATSDFWVRYETGREQPTFASEPLNRTLVIDQVVLQFWFTADRHVAKTGAANAGFAEWDAWFGTPESFGAVLAMDGPDTVSDGEVHSLGGTIAPPLGGLVVEANESLALMLRPVMLQSDANDLQLLVNSNATPTQIAVHWHERDPTTAVLAAAAALATPEESTFSGRLPAPAYAEAALGREPSGFTTGRHPFEVPAGAQKLEVVLSGTIAVGGKDLDLVLLDGTGAEVAQSVTPYANEHARLYAENLALLAPGPWTAQVNNWLGVGAEYDLVVRVWGPPATGPSP